MIILTRCLGGYTSVTEGWNRICSLIHHVATGAIEQGRKHICVIEGGVQKLTGVMEKCIHEGCIHESAVVKCHCILLNDIESSNRDLLDNRVRRDEVEENEFRKHFMMAILILWRVVKSNFLDGCSFCYASIV